MSCTDYEASCSGNVAGPQHTNSKSSLSPSKSLNHQSPSNLSSLYPFITETYRDLQSYVSGLHKDIQLIQTINKYKRGCNEAYPNIIKSCDISYQLAQNIVRTMDIFKDLSENLQESQLEEYSHRICEILSIYIVCELRISTDATKQERLLIAQRIIYIMRRHLMHEEKSGDCYNIVRTLVYIPKLFDARDIMCAIFSEFIPLKPGPEAYVLPDKLYILYIIVFFRWMMMQNDDDDKQLIINFAESFMKPSVTLCSNKLYSRCLPIYTKHSLATRTILNNLNCYGDIRNASILDNALKQNGSIVNLCDDEEDDIVFVDLSATSDFNKMFETLRLEPLSCSVTNIKLEEETVVGTVDLTAEEDPSSQTPLCKIHDKWLNDFQKLAKQYRESQTKQVTSNGGKEPIICLDSDTDEESEEISADYIKKTHSEHANQKSNLEDLFADNYPLTNTPLNCDSDLDFLDADDENDVTKISPRFLSSNLRTYEAKKSNMMQSDKKNNSGANEVNKSPEEDKAYRRDSIHISSSPLDAAQDDEGTDVQDENDEQLEEEEDEAQAYTFLPTTSKKREKEILPKKIQPMGPYPTYNTMSNDKVAFSHNVLRYSQEQQNQEKQHYHSDNSEIKAPKKQNTETENVLRYSQEQQKQHYHSDNSEIKTPKKQKKRVQFNTNPLGPIAASGPQKVPLKPSIQQTKYKVSDALEDYYFRGYELFPCAPSMEDSLSTSSSTKQQAHLEQATYFFRNSYTGPISPSLSSVSSRSLTSPATQSTSCKKSRFTKIKKPPESIIRNREILQVGYNLTGIPGTSSYGESSDDYYGIASDSEFITNERYRNDAKLRKRCAVVITPTKEILQYERKRNKMYNEILQKQRKKLELRALEKQREKERRRVSRREEKKEQAKSYSKETFASANNESVKTSRRTRSYHDIFMSSESEYETTFQVRTRKQKSQNLKDLEPLNIHIDATDSTTTMLLNQIDAHLDKPVSAIAHSFEMKDYLSENQEGNIDGNPQICDKSSEKNQTKMRELNLLADIAQHLSPYQLDLPDPQRSSSSPAPEQSLINNTASQAPSLDEVPKERIIVTEQLFIQPIDNLLEKRKPQLVNNYPQQQASSNYAHEPKFNIAAILKSSPCANLLQSENQQINTQLENNDIQRKEHDPKTQTHEILEKILEESISVLTVTSPFNPVKEQEILPGDSTIPILISNVESLNQFVQHDAEKEKFEGKVHLLLKNSKTLESEKLALDENRPTNNEKNYNTKDIKNGGNIIITSSTELSLNILNNVEPSIKCSTDLVDICTEKQIPVSLNIPPINAADLSDISLQSEISKHLPEIAEPSPVVTEFSDNSNESSVSKGFDHINNSNTSTAPNNEFGLSDLSLAIPNINQPLDMSVRQQNSEETNFINFNSTLNTPIKIAAESIKQSDSDNRSSDDLNTPIKFAAQPALETNTMPLKNVLEPDADNNVTKFLDLILNKTVTDAESEARDKIIKELNALTTDTRESLEVRGNINRNEIVQTKSSINEDEKSKSIDSKETAEEIVEETNFKQKTNLSPGASESCTCLEKNSLPINISEPKDSFKEKQQLHPPSANTISNPPKPNINEDQQEFECDKHNAKLSGCIKTLEMKQNLNKKCRVRLKRLSKKDPFNITKIESLPAIPVVKPVELDLAKCANVNENTLSLKKTCLKYNSKSTSKECDKKPDIFDSTDAPEVLLSKKPKLDIEKSVPIDHTPTSMSQKPQTPTITPGASVNNTTTTTKPKSKPLKTVTFDLSNLNEELRFNTISNPKQKLKSNAAGIAAGALGCFLKTSRPPRKLPDNTLRAAETLQLFVNTINASSRTPPPAEFNKKRSPIKNKCIAEDETPRPPPASTLMGTPPCKKSCTEKSRSHLTSKCKDQLVSSLTSSIPSITSDITTARIYTSSPLDQTLPEYDDNVDTVADSELILPSTTGSLRRKLKRPKKSLSRPEPNDDVCNDDIVNQADCNVEDDTDAVVDNEDDVFAEELLPIPAANEHILEEIVAARPTHIGTSAVIRDDFMNIEATATVPVYLFNDESRDLGSPEVIQSSEYTNVVDSSSFLNTTSATGASHVVATPASTTTAVGNLEKSMLSPSEHEVSSTQETFYQTPTKNKHTEIFVEKSSTSKEKGSSTSGLMTNIMLKPRTEDNNFKNKEDYQTSSSVGLLQNNQVDTTNHSPEMCTLALTSTTTTTPTLTNNRKIRKVSTHDEILFNELQQQQLPSNKRKPNNAIFCVESTSDNSNKPNKSKGEAKNLDDAKSNGSLAKVDDKFKKLLKEVQKIDKNKSANVLDAAPPNASYINGGGGSSPSTTTTINEENLSKSKRKKLKSSKSKKSKSRSEGSSKISLKPSKLTPHIPAKPLIVTIPKSLLLRPPSSPPTPNDLQEHQQHTDFSDIPNAELFIEKNKNKPTDIAPQNSKQISLAKIEFTTVPPVTAIKPNTFQDINDTSTESSKTKSIKLQEPNKKEATENTNSLPTSKVNLYQNTQTTKKKDKIKITKDVNCANTIFARDKYDLIKSKDKYNNNHNNQDHQDNKEKSKEKTSSHSKSLPSSNSRLHKGTSTEKIKVDKSKEKHKNTEKSLDTNVLKLTISQSNNKPLSSSSLSAILQSTAPLFSSNSKQSNSKFGKASFNSSSFATETSSAMLKSKKNPSTTQLSTAAAATASSEATNATLSVNNVPHLEQATYFFRNSYTGPISPSLSSVSSRSLTSPATQSTSCKKSRFTKIKQPPESIIRNREILQVGYNLTGIPGTSSYGESSDDYYGIATDSEFITNERYRNDAKLRKRCAVVITPTKEILQYERKRNKMYNKILKKQRKKLELRALEKQREKERKRVSRREEKKEHAKSYSKETFASANNEPVKTSRRTRTYHDIFMSSESEYETTFQVRTRKQKTQNLKDLEPLNIHIDVTDSTTTTLLNQIDAAEGIKQSDSDNRSPDDLNTPIKFAAQPALETNTMPLKNVLEPDADNYVTKFLDLILNKTVTYIKEIKI